MTIHLSWWVMPLVLVIAGPVLAGIFGKSRGDYDMVSGFIGLMWIGGCWIGAAAFTLAWLLK